MQHSEDDAEICVADAKDPARQLARLINPLHVKQIAIYAGLLSDLASRTNSCRLSLLTVKVKADSFKKVTKMIKDVIQKLM